MRRCWLSVLSLLGVASLADTATHPAPLWGDMLVKHRWNAVPDNWECLGHPPVGTTIDLHIALKPHRENALIDALYEVSDPKLPTYGAHLSREQVAELVAPHPDTLRLVYSWLEHGTVSSSISTTHGGGWLTVTDVPVSQVNRLLDASYQLYRHTGTNHTILRTVGYALPAALHGHVQMVEPTTYFSPQLTLPQTARKRFREETTLKAKATSGRLMSSRAVIITLEILRWLYNTQAYVPVAMDRNVIGIAGFDGESASQEDLTTFLKAYRADAEDATFSVVPINDGEYYDSSYPTMEASMNIQYTEGMTYPTPNIFYDIGGEIEWLNSNFEPAPGDVYLEWLDYLISQPKIPQTISISYGNNEWMLPEEYTTTLCDLFAQLGTRGTSVLFSSGNGGVGVEEPVGWDCKDRYGVTKFVNLFPATCPWVTTVGGTMNHHPEVAASLSGGGFSRHFPRPSYQEGAVTTFLKHLDTKYEGFYNPDGRGVPDISAQALEFKFVIGGRVHRMNGTSCAAPTVAGVISLLNDYLLASGKAPLGFLNLWLYEKGLPGINDIISGSNPGCQTDGFSAIVGWDPVTGLGTPDFVKLQRTLADRPVVSSIAVVSHSSMAPTPTPTCTIPASCSPSPDPSPMYHQTRLANDF